MLISDHIGRTTEVGEEKKPGFWELHQIWQTLLVKSRQWVYTGTFITLVIQFKHKHYTFLLICLFS